MRSAQEPLLQLNELSGSVDAERQFVEHALQVGELDRLDKIKCGAVLERIGRLFDFIDGGEHHDLGMVPRADIIDNIHFDRRHPFDVQKNDFDGLFFKEGQRLGLRCGLEHRKPLQQQVFVQLRTERLVVRNDENGGTGFFRFVHGQLYFAESVEKC